MQKFSLRIFGILRGIIRTYNLHSVNCVLIKGGDRDELLSTVVSKEKRSTGRSA